MYREVRGIVAQPAAGRQWQEHRLGGLPARQSYYAHCPADFEAVKPGWSLRREGMDDVELLLCADGRGEGQKDGQKEPPPPTLGPRLRLGPHCREALPRACVGDGT